MTLLVWITQSFLLSAAIFVLLGEQFVMDCQGELLCLKTTQAAGENKQWYSSERSRSNSQCCTINKTTKWQIPFGVLSVTQMTFSFVVYGVGTRGKSVGPFLSIVCATCWAMTAVLLFTKLAIHLLVPRNHLSQTTANSGHVFALFTLAWNTFTAIFTSACQCIFLLSANSLSTSENRDILKSEDLQDWLYFCSSDRENQTPEQTGANLSRVINVLIIAYFISSSYTLYLVLALEEYFEPAVKSVENSIGQPAVSDMPGDRGWNNFAAGRVGEGNVLESTTKTCITRNARRDLNKNELIVAFMENESDEDSFVFGWRL